VCLVAERLHKLGNTLKSANNHYNETVRGLVGKQGLRGKVERFQTLSAKASKELANLEPIHLDIENDRLETSPDAAEEEERSTATTEDRANPPVKLQPIPADTGN
jgi:DNA recombination protein RmuC